MNIRLTIITLLTVCAALWAMPETVRAQILVTNYTNNGQPNPNGYISEYDATTGATINASLVSGLNGAYGLTVSGGHIYVCNIDAGADSIGEYDSTTGAPINTAFITGLNGPSDVVVSGNNLFVANERGTTVGEYDATTGAPINASFITMNSRPYGLALSGGNLFVTGAYTIGEYDATTGATINASLVSGLNGAEGIAVSGGNLYVVNQGNSAIGEYDATTGATINAALVTGLNIPTGLAVSGGHLFVVNLGSNTVGEYDATTGAPINTSFITGLDIPVAITVMSTFSAQIQQPVNADGSSIFNANRGVVPVKFTLSQGGNQTCTLPPATIAVTRTAGGTIGTVDESVYVGSADTGSNFRISSCQYVYNLSASALGVGTYRVDILINGQVVGSGIFQLH